MNANGHHRREKNFMNLKTPAKSTNNINESSTAATQRPLLQ